MKIGNYEVDDVKGIPIKDLTEFVQLNKDFYINNWIHVYYGNYIGKINWACLFFPFFWFGYRKLHCFYILFLLFDLFINFNPILYFNIIYKLVIYIALVLLSNSLYFIKVEQIFKKYKKGLINERQYHELLKKDGGVSVLGGFLTIFVTVCWAILKSFVSKIL